MQDFRPVLLERICNLKEEEERRKKRERRRKKKKERRKRRIFSLTSIIQKCKLNYFKNKESHVQVNTTITGKISERCR